MASGSGGGAMPEGEERARVCGWERKYDSRNFAYRRPHHAILILVAIFRICNGMLGAAKRISAFIESFIDRIFPHMGQ